MVEPYAIIFRFWFVITNGEKPLYYNESTNLNELNSIKFEVFCSCGQRWLESVQESALVCLKGKALTHV